MRFPALLLLGACLGLLGDAGSSSAATAGLRLRFGLTDTEPTRWDGRVAIDSGRVSEIRGWRFERRDRVVGTEGWLASTHTTRTHRRSNRPGRQRAVHERPMDNGVVLSLEDVSEDSRVSVETTQGSFSITLSEVPFGQTRDVLNGAVEIERTAGFRSLRETPADDDFPAVAVDRKGRTLIAWVRFTPAHPGDPRILEFATAPGDFSFLTEPPGGDRVWLATLDADGRVSEQAITATGRDVFGCAIAVDADDRAWVFWAEKGERDFEVWARAVSDGVAGAPIRLSSGSGNQHSVVATTDASGRVWIAWQGERDGVLRILARRQLDDGRFGAEIVVSPNAASSWAPAIAASRGDLPGGPRVAISWDTYEKGDYDVWIREFDAAGTPAEARAAANTPKYEARSSIAYDASGNLWIAWEQSGPTWGKDRGALVRGKGVGLLEDRRIGLVVRAADGRWLEPQGSLQDVMPKPNRLVVPKRAPGEPLSEAARAALPFLDKPYHNLSRMAVDASGRPWLLFRSRAIDFRPTVGSMWLQWAAYYEDEAWIGPILIPNSDNLLYSAPGVVTPGAGGLEVVYTTDHRQLRTARRVPFSRGPLDVSNALSDPWINDLVVGRLETPREPTPARLVPARTAPRPGLGPTPATIAERKNAARARSARATVGDRTWRLARGEFHRHTELSSDGGTDGPLEDMWRYSIDVAALDWVGNGDHDNGHNREYPWWLIQKTTDAFLLPGRFTTLFSYERSRPFPEGHRNVVFPRRGIRPLAGLPLAKEKEPGPAADTAMLHRHLEQFGGISAPHTSATRMGTDWRNPGSAVEPVVEIYQGSRNSYEMPGAPRTATGGRARDERKEGFVSNALGKGQRLGFISSSDHHSTHISYAMAWVDELDRDSIFDALKARRVYAATDDIVADVRVVAGDEERFMGDGLSTTQPARVRIRLHGTAPFERVVVVKDGKEVWEAAPQEAAVALEWTDPAPGSGITSHYYVRGEQEDGELVWTSPIWVTYEEET